MGIHNTCLCKEVDKKYTGYNLKTTELLAALIEVCVVIRSNTVIDVAIFDKSQLLQLPTCFSTLQARS